MCYPEEVAPPFWATPPAAAEDRLEWGQVVCALEAREAQRAVWPRPTPAARPAQARSRGPRPVAHTEAGLATPRVLLPPLEAAVAAWYGPAAVRDDCPVPR